MPDTVLVVEDDDRSRTVLRMALEDEGYEVDAAGSGEDGVAAMKASPADFMIVDLMLGGVDGFTCIREVADGAMCRSSSSVPAPTPTTWWRGWRREQATM